MENTKSTFQFLLPYVLGLLVIRLIIDTFIKQLGLGYQGESYGSFLALLIEFAIIFITIMNFKKSRNNNTLQFTEGVKIGVGIMLIMGTLFTLYIFLIHNKLIDPDYQQNLMNEAMAKLKEQSPDANIQVLTKGTADSPIGLAFSILKYIFIGALGGVISSAFLKTEK